MGVIIKCPMLRCQNELKSQNRILQNMYARVSEFPLNPHHQELTHHTIQQKADS